MVCVASKGDRKDALPSVFFYVLLTCRVDAERTSSLDMAVMTILFTVMPGTASTLVILALEAGSLHSLP